jgi:regulator of protease activity HflC (stomatin/prohibitin superfamily)
MVRAIARQAEAERERRAKIINAEGEFQAAQKLLDAARVLAPVPQAMQLRYLAALFDIAGDRTSTIVFPFPMELAQVLGMQGLGRQGLSTAAPGAAAPPT